MEKEQEPDKPEIKEELGVTDVTDISESLLGEMSEVQEHAIESELENSNPEPQESGNRTLVDADGNTFDPSFHQVDSDGKPVIRKNGLLAKKRGAGSKKAKSKLHEKKSNVNSPVVENPESFAMMGRMAAGATVSIAMALGGDDFQPIQDKSKNVDEMEHLSFTWAEWLKANDMKDLPPNWALAIGLSAYVMPRFANPEPRRRIGYVTDKIFGLFKKKGKKNGSQLDNRTDGKRKDEPSEKAGE